MHKSGPGSRSSATTSGYLAIAFAALLWAVAAVVASRLFDDGVDPLELAAARSFVTLIGLALVARYRAGRLPPLQPSRVFVALGLAIALVNATYYTAIDHLPVAVALVIQYTAPVLIVVYVATTSRRLPSVAIVVALISAIAGVLLVSEVLAGDLGDIDGFGLMMALGSAGLFALYTLLSERVVPHFGPVASMLKAFVVSSAFWVVYQLPRGWPAELFESDNVLRVSFVGVAGTLAPFLLYVWGVQRVRAERASIAATLEPVFGAVIAWAWLDQSLTALQVAGGVLVIGGVVALQTRRKESLRAPEP